MKVIRNRPYSKRRVKTSSLIALDTEDNDDAFDKYAAVFSKAVDGVKVDDMGEESKVSTEK